MEWSFSIKKDMIQIFQNIKSSICILLLVILGSCQSITMEQQVQNLSSAKEEKDRESIAQSLADSLDTRAINLILASDLNDDNLKQVLRSMMARYAEIISNGENSEVKNAKDCVYRITSPEYNDSRLPDIEKLNLIIHGLDQYLVPEKLQSILNSTAIEHGAPAMSRIIEEWYNDKESKPLLAAIQAFHDDAIVFLVEQLGEKSDNEEELLGRLGQPAVEILLKKMKNKNQDIRFAAADALVKMVKYHPDALSNLTDVVYGESTDAIAQNYPFYIRLGIEGTEDLLLQALDNHFTQTMCVDYLNCGNEKIESRATEIANQRGYNIISTPGSHNGPKWGTGGN